MNERKIIENSLTTGKVDSAYTKIKGLVKGSRYRKEPYYANYMA